MGRHGGRSAAGARVEASDAIRARVFARLAAAEGISPQLAPAPAGLVEND